jgi:hypothetical protein
MYHIDRVTDFGTYMQRLIRNIIRNVTDQDCAHSAGVGDEAALKVKDEHVY